MNLVEAVDVSVGAMVEDGSLDLKRHAAPIEVLRRLAVIAEGADGSTSDNVTIPTMIKCMSALGMMPEAKARPGRPSGDKAKKPDLKLMQGKFAKQAKSAAANG